MSAGLPHGTDDGVRLPVPAVASGWRRTIAADGTSIAWRADGGPHEGVALVLCNGIACTDTYWRDLLGTVASRRRVIRWDYPGHGRSGPPASQRENPVAAVVDDLRAVLDAAEVRSAVLAGHSFGVQVALEAAHALPRRIAGIVAVAGGPDHVLGQHLARLALPRLTQIVAEHPDTTMRLWQRFWRAEGLDLLARLVGGTNGNVSSAVLSAYFEHVAGRDPRLLLDMFAGMASHDAADLLEGLRIPFLALAGDGDGLTTVDAMARMAVRARGELITIPGGAHTLPAEHPAEVASHLLELCERVDRERRTDNPR